jgi:hypothetical protein
LGTRFHLFQRGPSFGLVVPGAQAPWGSWEFPSLSERTFFRTIPGPIFSC